ncbi:MAG: TatD family hydrolase [Salinivirgaceae bacterium]|nr:TatD family hydrolase [Salinivirgaceae bacterium]
MTTPFVNIHTHTETGSGIELVNIDDISETPYATFASAGLHPWNVGKCDHQKTIAAIENLCQSGRLAAVGEIGIDRAVRTDISLQMSVFEQQLDIAKRHQLPVIIHCVRTYSDFLQILRREHGIPMIFHGFSGNATTAAQLLTHGAKLSFGHKLLSDSKLQSVYANVPNDCIFLETDTKQLDISDIYTFAAELKHISIDELKTIIFSNLTQLFGNRWTTVG